MLAGVKDVEAPTKTCVSIDEWVDVWGLLVGKAKKMDDFPMWLQYYPKVLFDVINRSGKLDRFWKKNFLTLTRKQPCLTDLTTFGNTKPG